MHEVYLCLDVGGTEIKAAPLDANGKMLSKIQYFPAMACADKKTLLEHFAHIFTSICPADKVPIEIDLAFPGPFDYENGICLLQGLEKYDALYGCNLRHAFAALSGLPQKRIQFINDAAAFALGELTFGSSRQAHKTLFTVIGTGCGSAFGVDGFLAAKGHSVYLLTAIFIMHRLWTAVLMTISLAVGWKSLQRICSVRH